MAGDQAPDDARELFTTPQRAREEAPAAMRQASKAMRGLYVSLLAEGFTRSEAMGIVSTILTAAVNKGDGTG